jgi:fucose permease
MYIIIAIIIVSLMWGWLTKAIGVVKGLDERTSFILGLCFWLVGLIIVIATPSKRGSR